MKVLKIIHGYPPRYNAGSEVYSQMLCQGLARRQHEVTVFTREENPFLPDYQISIESDIEDSRIKLQIMNLVSERYRYRYRHEAADVALTALLKKLKPDIVHIGHLNHLSTSFVTAIHQQNIPIVFTLHDYWLMCPRGQFMQRLGKTPDKLWPVCDGQENRKCACHCYAGAASGNPETHNAEIQYWENWVGARMTHIREICGMIDYFIAPSRYLYQRFLNDFHLPAHKMTYCDYGFALNRLSTSRQRTTGEPFTFGYIGTHIPAKGIQDLIRAFGFIESPCQLRLWGKPTANTSSLQVLVNTLPPEKQKSIEWKGEYVNQQIMETVFNHVDCIVVPSIWVENSPLVIHEALQAKVPVITANTGGMMEYIHHHVNGLLFEHRNIQHLAEIMHYALMHPDILANLGKRGYLSSQNGQIKNIETHVEEIEQCYQLVLERRNGNASNAKTERPLADHF